MTKLVYQPNLLRGPCTFEVDPQPTDEVLDIIGQEGVEQMHELLAEMLEVRKRMFGTLSFAGNDDPMKYGFAMSQKFVDLDSKYIFQLYQKVVNGVPYDTESTWNPYYDHPTDFDHHKWGKWFEPVLADTYSIKVDNTTKYKQHKRIIEELDRGTPRMRDCSYWSKQKLKHMMIYSKHIPNPPRI